MNEEIARLVRPLVKQATILKLSRDRRADRRDKTGSFFGGVPYAEPGESWPVCPGCSDGLSFICQVNLDGCAHKPPPGVRLFAFFYCWECSPWGMDSGPLGRWLVRIYSDPSRKKAVKLRDRSPKSYRTTRCSVRAVPAESLPEWEGISRWCRPASDLSAQANPDEPWEPYQTVAAEMTGRDGFATVVGGYPR